MDEINSTISRPIPLPLQFDEFCDILGGQSWLHFIYNLKATDQQNRVKTVSKLKLALTGKHRFLCSGDLLDRQALEIYYIKLSALVRATQVIKDAHQLLSSPLLNISSNSIRVGVHTSKSLAPSIWNYQLVYDRSEPDNLHSFDNPNSKNSDHSVSPQHDFYCLGMLIARALIVNRSQSMESVKNKLDDLAKTITDIYEANKNSLDQDDLHSRLLQVLDSFLNKETFLQRNLIFKPHYYTKDLIDPTLWRGILSIVFQLITNIPGFSYFSKQNQQDDDMWAIAQRIFDELSDAEHQAKRNLLTESINPGADLHKLAEELTASDNWQAEYFDAENTLKKANSNDDMVEIDIFGLEQDLTPGKMLKAKSPREPLTSNNDSSISLEYFENILED